MEEKAKKMKELREEVEREKERREEQEGKYVMGMMAVKEQVKTMKKNIEEMASQDSHVRVNLGLVNKILEQVEHVLDESLRHKDNPDM